MSHKTENVWIWTSTEHGKTTFAIAVLTSPLRMQYQAGVHENGATQLLVLCQNAKLDSRDNKMVVPSS